MLLNKSTCTIRNFAYFATLHVLIWAYTNVNFDHPEHFLKVILQNCL